MQTLFFIVKSSYYLLFCILFPFNPYHAKFLKWNNPPSIYGTVQRYQDENFKLVSQQYRAWSDCTDVQADPALYWWQRLITFGAG